MYPEAGGTSSYARAAFGQRAGFLVGWLIEAMAILAAAAVAIGFGHYAHDLLGVPPRWSAVTLLVLMGGVVWFGIRETVIVTVIFTLIEAVGLAVVVVTGARYVNVEVLTDAPAGAPVNDVVWEVRDRSGQQIWRTSQPEPRVPLAAGRYVVSAENRERKYNRTFDVATGDDKTIEVIVE